MYERKVRFKTIDNVKIFCQEAGRIPCDIDIITEYRHIVDAKSIMGIFSLDLSKPVTVKAISEDKTIVKMVSAAIEAAGINID